MATAFSTANMKAEFPNIRLACSQLIEVLKTMGPEEVVDMDSALCRESLDVIGPSQRPSVAHIYGVHHHHPAVYSAGLQPHLSSVG